MRNIGLYIGSLGKGGAERIMSVLGNSLVKDNSVTLYLFSDRTIVYELDPKIRVVVMRKHGLVNEFLYVLDSLKYLDVAIAFTTKINILVILASKIRGHCKVIVSERTSRKNQNIPRVWRTLRLLYSFCDSLVLPSKKDVCYYNKFVKNVYVIPNGNNMSWKSLKARDNIVLMIGRLERVKNHMDILKIVSKNRNLFLDRAWSVVIHGEGSLFGELSEFIALNHLENIVTVKPFVSDVQRVYHNAKVYVLPSLYEGYPNTLCEALVSGCVCLSYDIDTGPGEIITDMDNGILIEKGRSDLMEKSLLHLIESNDKLRHYNQGARRVSNDFTTEKMLERWRATL